MSTVLTLDLHGTILLLTSSIYTKVCTIWRPFPIFRSRFPVAHYKLWMDIAIDTVLSFCQTENNRWDKRIISLWCFIKVISKTFSRFVCVCNAQQPKFVLVSQATPLNFREKRGLVTTSCTMYQHKKYMRDQSGSRFWNFVYCCSVTMLTSTRK